MVRKSTRGKTPALLTRIPGPPDGFDHCLGVLRPADVAGDEAGPAPRPSDLASDPLGGGAVVEVVDAHVGARAGERDRDGVADALLRARHQRDLPGELHAFLHSVTTEPIRSRPDVYGTARFGAGEAVAHPVTGPPGVARPRETLCWARSSGTPRARLTTTVAAVDR
jgi:hypothetical protein